MQSPTTPILLYGFPLSGHAHRVRLFLTLLHLPFEEVTVDLTKGEQQASEFLGRNLFGQVPVIEDGGVTLADSNAILVYLATAYDPDRRWLPTDPVTQAEVQRWLSAAAGPLFNGPSAARVAALFGQPANPVHAATAEKLLAVMEGHLKARDWLASDHVTIADLAMYTYTSHAPEGGISLDPFPAVRAWLSRVEALPDFVGMVRTPA